MRISPETGFIGVSSKQAKLDWVGGGRFGLTVYCLHHTATSYVLCVAAELTLFLFQGL